MRTVTGRSFRDVPARLRGFERFMLKGRVYPGISENSSGETLGRVYFDLDEASLARLDFFEADEYERERREVELEDETVTEAFVYIIPSGREDLLCSEPWDEAGFISERLDGFLEDTRRWMSGYSDASR